MKIKIFYCFLLLSFMYACNSEKESPVHYVDEGLVTLNEQPEQVVIITEDTGFKLCLDGVEDKDKVYMRLSEDTTNEIAVRWGYLYQGKDESGKPSWAKDTVITQLKFDDRWESGKWDVIVQRDNQRQVLTSVTCQILKFKEDAENPDSYFNTDEIYKGLFYIYADGWLGGGTDYYQFVNKATNKSVIFESNIDPNDLPTVEESATISFPRDTLSTGSYDFYIQRWKYNFRQYVCSFDYFRIALVSNEPIVKNEKGEYTFDFYLDKIVDKDKVRVGYGSKGFEYALTADNYDEATNIYHVVIKDKDVPKEDAIFTIALSRDGSRLTIGTVDIIVQ